MTDHTRPDAAGTDIVHELAQNYALDGDNGYYTPTDAERAMLEDFGNSLRERLAAAPPPPHAQDAAKLLHIAELARQYVEASWGDEHNAKAQRIALIKALTRPDYTVIDAADLSALAPYLAASADVRRAAMEEAALNAERMADAIKLRREASGAVDRYDPLNKQLIASKAMARDIAYATRAIAGSPPSAEPVQVPDWITEPASPLDDLTAWAKDHPPSEEQLQAQPRRWRHKARGTTYIEVSREYSNHFAQERSGGGDDLYCAAVGRNAQVQGKIARGTRVVFYRAEADDALWCRAEGEFRDGRFEEITEPADDVTALRASIEESLRLQAEYRAKAESALREAQAEIARITRVCDERVDHLREAVEDNTRLVAKLDQLAEAARALVEFCDDPDGAEKPDSLALGLARLLPDLRAALSSLSAPEPAEPGDIEVSDLARVIAAQVNPHGWANMSLIERDACCAAARMAIQANTPRSVLAAKGGE